MASTANPASNRVYEDFDPSTEWVREPLADTLMVYLPGFRKEQLKVQVTSAKNLNISGTRQLNDNKWSRFRKEIPIPSNYDINGISARFEKGILYVRNPKLIVPESPAPPELSKPTMEQSTKPPSPPQGTPQQTKEPPNTKETLEFTEWEPHRKTSSMPKKITYEESTVPEAPKPQVTPKPTKQGPPKPSKSLQEPENQPKAEPSNPLEAPKSQNPPEETPKQAKEEPSELDKPRTEREKKEEVVRARKVANKGATSEQENAGNSEKAEALPEINESGSCKFVMEYYKDSICGLMKEMKNARNVTNKLLAILFCAVLGWYIRNAVNSFTKPEK